MRLALVHDWLTGMRGGEKCLEVLCRRFPDAKLYTLIRRPGVTSPAIERMEIETSYLQRVPGATRMYRYLLPLMPAAVERLKIPRDVDLVVSFSHAVAKGISVPAGVPHVCYCFTPMRYVWHRRSDYFGRSGDGWNPVSAVRNRLLDQIRNWDRASADRVDHFIAISQTVRRRIAECYGRPSEVIYPPVDTRFYAPADVPREDFYLCVSALVPYKRIDQAIDACNRLGRRLVVIGEGPQRRRLARRAGATVRLLGWASDAAIRDHLRRARALLFPGHEDFGIVPLEAQACGTPVIALDQGGATETVIAADEGLPGTGVLYEEASAEGLAGAIERFEQGKHPVSGQWARRQAEQFSLQRFERELIAYLENIVQRNESPCRKAA